jgi:hypothetical protein
MLRVRLTCPQRDARRQRGRGGTAQNLQKASA